MYYEIERGREREYKFKILITPSTLVARLIIT
jgi:hypothetical protein